MLAPNTAAGALLETKGLEKRFGGIAALSDYHLTLTAGELVGLIGPNGAGKTTVFNLLSGVLLPSAGKILFDGRDITRLRPDQTAALGMARTFQNIRLFQSLSVLDNIKVAFHMRTGRGLWPTLLHSAGYRRSERDMTRQAEEFIDLLELKDVRSDTAESLPYGLQRRVEIARALAALPKLLLLDEPAAGMNPNESAELMRIIGVIHQRYQKAILLVEHDMKVVMGTCQRVQVLDRGRLLTSGTPAEVRQDPRVIEAYLGTAQKARHAGD